MTAYFPFLLLCAAANEPGPFICKTSNHDRLLFPFSFFEIFKTTPQVLKYGNDHNILFPSYLQVLMYPVLLDDQSLANQFQMFIEKIDETYEVSLSTNQQYPVS